MNNDLEQFSEERLKELANENIICKVSWDERVALALIALSVKQAKPVAWTSQSNLDAVDLKIPNNLEFMSGDKGIYKRPVPLYTTPQPAYTEQDGWKLVPIEPTIGMLINGVIAGVNASPDPWCPHVWAAMLAAAPKPESE